MRMFRARPFLVTLGLVVSLIAGAPGHAQQPSEATQQAPQGAVLSVSAAATLVSDQGGAGFAMAVATAGDVNGDSYADVLVGAPQYDAGHSNNGKAFLYYGSATGLATTAGWSAHGAHDEAVFGGALATAGDVNGDGYADVIVGAPWQNGDHLAEGAFCIYHGSPAGLAAEPALIVFGASENAHLGCAVSTAGDVNGDGFDDVIVGAYGVSGEAGAAYIHYGSADGIAASPAWSVAHTQGLAAFGAAVGTAGDVNADGYADVIVGAPNQSGQGAAYVYLGAAAGPGSSPAWTKLGGQSGANYGRSVDTAGDVNGDGYSDVIVGAPLFSDGQTREGRAEVFYGGSSGLTANPVWVGQIDWGGAQLGYSVGPAGDVNGDGYADVLAGAPYYASGQTNEGAAYLFQGGDTGMGSAVWEQQSNLANYRFGQAVGAAGDVNGDGYGDLIVGAPGGNRAYVLHGCAGAPATTPTWMVESNVPYFGYGRQVAPAGDVNGDGYADVVVGSSYQAAADYTSGTDVSDGRVDVHYGSATGLSAAPDWTMTADQSAACYGNAVASAGDVNGDGYADIIVGAFLYDQAQIDGGAAFVYYGSPDGLQATPAWSGYGSRALAYYGRAVASAGDVNGDGYADVIVGAYGYSRGETTEGAAHIYLGSPTGLSSTPAWFAESNQSGAWYGYSVASAGDVDNDGYDDVLVGARRYTHDYTWEGAAFLYRGSSSGPSSTADWIRYGGFDVGPAFCGDPAAPYVYCVGEFGCSVASAGDVNGDGYADVVIGARKSGHTRTWAGRAYVFHGTASGLATTPAWHYEAPVIKSELGYCVASAGDVNGDGYSDVIVGANHYRAGDPWMATDEGKAWVFLGAPAGLGVEPAWSVTGDIPYACMGQSVASAGDVNADGYADLLVSAPTYSNGQPNEGRAYFFWGNGGPGLPLRVGVLLEDQMTPLQPLARTDRPTSAPIAVTARMPLGRAPAQLAWQLAPRGVALGADGTLSGKAPDWVVAMPGGTPQNARIEGLQPASAWHWRARLIYRPGNRVGAVASRWLQGPILGAQQTDFVTPQRIVNTQSVALAKGWNLVSFSGQPVLAGLPLTRVADILASIDGAYDVVQRYDATHQGSPWLSYDPANPEAGDLQTLTPGEGFWIHMTSAATWTLRVEQMNGASIALQPGWNLIGWPLPDEQTLPQAVQRIEGDYSIIWAYDALATPPGWEQFVPTAAPWANVLIALTPGEGYWLHATAQCALYVSR